MAGIWNYILTHPNEFIVNIIAGLVCAAIIAIISWAVNRIKNSDEPVKHILIIASLIIILLAVLYREKVISYVPLPLRIISDNMGLFIAATIVGILTFMDDEDEDEEEDDDEEEYEEEEYEYDDDEDDEATFTPLPTKSVTRTLPSSPYRNEIPDSWEEIIASIDDGTAQQRYAVGAYKPLNLGQFGTVNMQLAGFNLDERADGRGKAATTWIAKEILSETHRWNPGWNDGKAGTGTIGGWAKCELRKWMNEMVRPAIPENVRNRLVPVKKSQECYDTNGNWIQQTTKDSVWIPSCEEVFGNQSLYCGLFRNQDKRRVKRQNGSAAWWWLRSASYFSLGASIVASGGYHYYYDVDHTSVGVVLGFCL